MKKNENNQTFFRKNPIISLSYTPESLTVDGKHYFPEASLRLAYSGNAGNTWKILPTSVVDDKNNTVAALHKVGGSYMIVGNFVNQRRRSN